MFVSEYYDEGTRFISKSSRIAVESIELLDRPHDQLAHLRGIAHVATDGDGLASRTANLRDDVVTRVKFATRHHHLAARRRETTSDRRTEPSRAARDDGDTIGEVEERSDVQRGDGRRV